MDLRAVNAMTVRAAMARPAGMVVEDLTAMTAAPVLTAVDRALSFGVATTGLQHNGVRH